jgi:histone-lysine N-methyltransferase SETD2
MMGITGIGTFFFVTLASLCTEKESDYTWMLQQLLASIPSFPKPGVVMTDKDLALMNALSSVFPTSKHVLCKWHIKKNVEAKCWPFFADLRPSATRSASKRWEQFLSDWDAVVEALTVPEYNRQWNAMKSRHCLHFNALRYVETVWLQS